MGVSSVWLPEVSNGGPEGSSECGRNLDDWEGITKILNRFCLLQNDSLSTLGHVILENKLVSQTNL